MSDEVVKVIVVEAAKPPYDWKKSVWKGIKAPAQAAGVAFITALALPESRQALLSAVPAEYALIATIAYGALVFSINAYTHIEKEEL